MGQARDLRDDRLVHLLVGVSEGNRHYAAEKVEIGLAIKVSNPTALAVRYHYRVPVQVLDLREDVLLVLLQYVLDALAPWRAVWVRSLIECAHGSWEFLAQV